MKVKILFSSLLLLLSFIPLSVNACPSGNSQILNYIRRDNNRCEGLKSQSNVTRPFELISFSTSNLTPNYNLTG